jgi:hypothetical protein
MVNSPANPTGATLAAERLAALADLAEAAPAGAWLVSDEIYHGLTYEGREHTALEFTDRAFVLNGFSKAYAMTGFRLGWRSCRTRAAAAPGCKEPLHLREPLRAARGPRGAADGVHARRDARGLRAPPRPAAAGRRPGFGVPAPGGRLLLFADARFGATARRLALLERAQVGTRSIDFGAAGRACASATRRRTRLSRRRGVRMGAASGAGAREDPARGPCGRRARPSFRPRRIPRWPSSGARTSGSRAC